MGKFVKRVILLISILTSIQLQAMQSFEELKTVLKDAPAEIADKIIRQYFKDLLASSISMRDLQKKVIEFSRQGSFFYGIANSKEGQHIISYAAQFVCKKQISGIQQIFNKWEKKLKNQNPNFEYTFPDLITNGINATNDNGENALHILLRYPKRQLSVIENLIACGINVNQQTPGPARETPLSVAAQAYNIPAMKVLIQNGAQVNLKNTTKSPLNQLLEGYAYGQDKKSQEEVYKTAQFLLEHGSYVDDRTIKALSVPNTYQKIIDLVLKYATPYQHEDLRERLNYQLQHKHKRQRTE